MWNYLIPSKEVYALMGFFLIGSSPFLGSDITFLGGIVCWCAAGIMAHDGS